MQILENYLLKNFTTMAMGGPARFFVRIKNEIELLGALKFTKQKRLPWYVVGDGSNLIVSDTGFKGVIIQNQIKKFDLSFSFSLYPFDAASGRRGRRRKGRVVKVGAGNNLLKFIFKLSRLGLAGMEKMAGIPGSVGGAIYGCAGAYGQEIKDYLVSVKIFDGKKIRILSQKQCKFGYRESIFKKQKNWIILGASFQLWAGEKSRLEQTSREIIKLRQKKYWPSLKCPGSFFKNIKLSAVKSKLRKKFLRKIDKRKIIYGKVPTGYLLEEVGAKGMELGSIRVAQHHANLIYNPNGAQAKDVKLLANLLKKLVKKNFGIIIEEEVQYLP